MRSNWAIHEINIKKQMIKVYKLESSATKTIFIPGLLEARMHLNTLLATCQDCTWVVDVVTGVRRRVSDKVVNDVVNNPHLVNAANVIVPEFLKKQSA
jgi:hypothetical protein